VQAGFTVTLTGGSGRIAGRVARIDPAVQNGAVPVHVALAATPAFARPAMHVDGAIELSRIPNALSIARPAGASDDAVIDLYRVAPDGRTATRVRVQLAHGSTQRIEVRSGLRAGQSVIISDTSGAQDAPRITLR
jgi:multidrug efflux pump subunit AcrA (membrane-fusion protein)